MLIYSKCISRNIMRCPGHFIYIILIHPHHCMRIQPLHNSVAHVIRVQSRETKKTKIPHFNRCKRESNFSMWIFHWINGIVFFSQFCCCCCCFRDHIWMMEYEIHNFEIDSQFGWWCAIDGLNGSTERVITCAWLLCLHHIILLFAADIWN